MDIKEQRATRIRARQLLVKLNLYKGIAYGFGVAGLLIMSYVFAKQGYSSFFVAMTDPVLVGILVFPFIPCIIFSYQTQRLHTQLSKLIEEHDFLKELYIINPNRKTDTEVLEKRLEEIHSELDKKKKDQ